MSLQGCPQILQKCRRDSNRNPHPKMPFPGHVKGGIDGKNNDLANRQPLTGCWSLPTPMRLDQTNSLLVRIATAPIAMCGYNPINAKSSKPIIAPVKRAIAPSFTSLTNECDEEPNQGSLRCHRKLPRWRSRLRPCFWEDARKLCRQVQRLYPFPQNPAWSCLPTSG